MHRAKAGEPRELTTRQVEAPMDLDILGAAVLLLYFGFGLGFGLPSGSLRLGCAAFGSCQPRGSLLLCTLSPPRLASVSLDAVEFVSNVASATNFGSGSVSLAVEIAHSSRFQRGRHWVKIAILNLGTTPKFA